MAAKKTETEAETLSFADLAAFERWLAEHHRDSAGIWLRLAKKGAGVPSVTYAEAVEVALCYGWIDGQKRPQDERFWLQRFTPRGPRSIWSKINQGKVQELINAGRMQPAGQAAIDLARRTGSWEAAYDPASKAQVPAYFQEALDRHPTAAADFAALDRANRFAMLFRLQTAKREETRARLVQRFIEMLEKGERIH